MTEEALKNCVQDMMILNDDSVKKSAVEESEEEVEEAFEAAEADEKDLKQELASERALLTSFPKGTLVLQYSVNDGVNWKNIRAYPKKMYGDFTENWQELTVRIPQHAMTKKTRIRFYQEGHTCFCCNVFNDVKHYFYGGAKRIPRTP